MSQILFRIPNADIVTENDNNNGSVGEVIERFILNQECNLNRSFSNQTDQMVIPDREFFRSEVSFTIQSDSVFPILSSNKVRIA